MHRFMPSLAVDRDGNMALGYSTSNSTSKPAMKYAGRLATDPIEHLPQSEQVLIQGAGTQFGNCGGGPCSRWGDYAAMTLDPDGCRFWFTGEYYAADGLDYQTRTGSFAFPSCTPVSSTEYPSRNGQGRRVQPHQRRDGHARRPNDNHGHHRLLLIHGSAARHVSERDRHSPRVRSEHGIQHRPRGHGDHDAGLRPDRVPGSRLPDGYDTAGLPVGRVGKHGWHHRARGCEARRAGPRSAERESRG